MSEARDNPSDGGASRGRGLLWLALLVTLLWYLPLLHGSARELAYDDVPSILEAPNVRRLWPLGTALGAPPGSGASGRPLVALSLALDYALHGTTVRGYHVFNVALHLCASLALYALVRTIARRRGARASELVALGLALPWAAHPLHTMAVDNIVYRNELLVGLFYLLALLAGLRATRAERPARWILAAGAAAWLGAASKEVIVSLPLVFLALHCALERVRPGTALRAHKALYASLASAWLPLACFVAWGDRGESVGLREQGLSSLDYLRTQSTALLHYLRLLVWPSPLVLDYDGWPIARSFSEVIWQGPLVLALCALALWSSARKHLAGALGLSALLVLAPSSSVIPLTGALLGEHRMYLPSAALLGLSCLGGTWLAGRAHLSESRRSALLLALALLVTLPLGLATHARHAAYASELSIWEDTATKRPDNPRAWSSIGVVHAREGRPAEAEEAYRRALAVDARYHTAHINYGNLLLKQGRIAEAHEHYLAAARLRPELAEPHYYTGSTAASLGRWEEGHAELGRALELSLDPRLIDPCRLELAWLLATADASELRDGPRALELASSAQGSTPGARARDVLAAALAEVGRYDDAAETVEGALRGLAKGGAGGYAELLRARAATYRAGRPWRERRP